MAYKIRVILNSNDDVFRDIELRDNQTLWNLHNGIKSAFSLQGDEISMFNVVNEDGEVLKSIPLEDISDEGDGETMSEVYLSEVFPDKGIIGHFQYGSIELWEFICEFVDKVNEKKGVNYPLTTYRFGKVPLKAPAQLGISTFKMDDLDLDLDLDIDDDEFSSEGFENIDDYIDDEI